MSKDYEVWCQDCGCSMKLRDGKYGKFYGCTGYPVCRNTLNLRDAQLRIEQEDGDHGNYDPNDDFIEPDRITFGPDGHS